MWGFTSPVWNAFDPQCWVHHKYSALSQKTHYLFPALIFCSPFSSTGTTNGLRIWIFVAEEMVVLEGAAEWQIPALRAEGSCSSLVSCVSPGSCSKLNGNQLKGSVGCWWRFTWLGPSNVSSPSCFILVNIKKKNLTFLFC